MEYIIRRVNDMDYSVLCSKVKEYYEEYGTISNIRDEIDNFASDVKYMGKTVKIDLDIEEYLNIVKLSNTQAEKNIMLTKKMCCDFKDVPDNVLMDKYVWVYLNIRVFYDIIEKHMINYRLEKGLKDPTEEKIKQEMNSMIDRYYLSKVGKTKISRSGMRWFWYVAYKVENDYKYIEYVFKKIDPIRAVMERHMCDNTKVLRAYIICINRLFDERGKMLNDSQRTKVPTHLYCYGAVNRFDAYDEKNLSDKMYEQAKYILE